MVSQQLLDELQIIIQEDYGVELPPQTISEVVDTLVGFTDLLASIEFGGEKTYDNETIGNS